MVTAEGYEGCPGVCTSYDTVDVASTIAFYKGAGSFSLSCVVGVVDVAETASTPSRDAAAEYCSYAPYANVVSGYTGGNK